MAMEMGANRLISPYFGTSLLIWANLIGLVLIYLTVGYTVGGRLADRFPQPSSLYKVTAWVGFCIVIIPIVSEPLLRFTALGFRDISSGLFFGSLLSILVLFSVPLILLGTVSPWAIRLSVTGISSSGSTAGTLYALSTLGSIIGTFVPVLILQPTIGTRASMWCFGVMLLFVSLCGLVYEVRRRALPYAAILAAAVLIVVVFQRAAVSHETSKSSYPHPSHIVRYVEHTSRDSAVYPA